MKTIALSMFLMFASLNSFAQICEPTFTGQVNVLCINDADTVCLNAEQCYGTIKTKSKTSLFSKIASVASHAGGAVIGIGAAVGGMSGVNTIVSGMKVMEAADAAGHVADASELLAGKAFITSSYTIPNPSSSCVLQQSKRYAMVVRVENNNVNPAELVQIMRLEQNKKQRYYKVVEIKNDGSSSVGADNILPYQAAKYGKSSYILYFNPQPGEYAVSTGGNNLLVYCFAIKGETN